MDVLSVAFDRHLLAREGYVDGNAVVIRRFRGLHCSRIRRPRGIAPREDWELVYRISRRRRTLHVPVPTVHYQVHQESYWSNWPEDLAFQDPSASNSISGCVSLSRLGGSPVSPDHSRGSLAAA